MKLPQSKKVIYVISLILINIIIFSCNFNNQFNKTKDLIYGDWVLENKKPVNYPEIVFNEDSTAIFKSRADTIYRFCYVLNGSDIILKDINNKKETYKILKLTKDSLIFSNLRENISQQIYTRRSKKDNPERP